ncbi:hypothetical protein [Cupriavidus agavae]|uniref:hypothetical protein n=1 Tax=Cupriavidus agavae TaxID=1001822 RepID=UPI0018E53B78|nr:hypothetical protein [Cupriavidus agavae]
MNIVLFRNSTRALILPAGKTLLDCPLEVRCWLGAPCAETATAFTLDTPMPGIHPPLVLAQLLQRGYCALDLHGVVQNFRASNAMDQDEPIVSKETRIRLADVDTASLISKADLLSQ